MRYIKLYESFDTDIEDILLEINDLGYKTTITTRAAIRHDYTFICIMKIDEDLHYINLNDIKDCVLRLQDYLGNKYIGCEIYKEGGWKRFEFTEDCYFTTPVSSLLLEYKKT